MKEISKIINDKVSCEKIVNYISTENMLPNKRGIVSATTFPSSGTVSVYKKGDILLSNIRPYFKKIWRATCNGTASNDVIVFRANKDVDSMYLYYVLADDRLFTYVMTGAKGTKMPRGDKNQIMNYQVNLPPLEEQKRIAEVLGAFDDKIELLQKQNKTLEEMAKAIFKSWFVDFDIVKAKQKGDKKEDIIKNYHLTEELYNLFPSSFEQSPLGPIPTGWRVGKLVDVANILGGFAFKSNDFTNVGAPVIKIKNIQGNHFIDFKDVQYVNRDFAVKMKKFILLDGDIVMAMTGATIGKFALVVNPKKQISILNQRVAKISAKNDKEHWFVYFSLLQYDVEEQVKNNGLGSAQANISTEGIGNSIIIVPKSSLKEEFTTYVNSYIKKILYNKQQIQTLTELRDTLLPRLISGKIKV
ncbi:MAG: restriction endonuclease subunit S [Elusimicrobiaceae bacterium]|nr:restriction endonuclease subunit S [Elusimicrobiaceae bacterium]